MATGTIKNRNPYSNTMIFSDTWINGFVIEGNGAFIMLQLPYPYTSVKSHTLNNASVYFNGSWISCSVSSVGVSTQGISIALTFTNQNSQNGKNLLFKISGNIVLE